MKNLVDSYIDSYLEKLSESYSSSSIRRTSANKTSSTTGSIELALARKANDPLYRKMQMYRDLYLTAKTQLKKKYKSKATALARQRASKYKRS